MYSGSQFRVQSVMAGKSRLQEFAAVGPPASAVKGQIEDEVEPVPNSLPSSFAHSPGSSAQEAVLLVRKMSLPSSLNQDVPHKHEQRLITQVILSQPLFQIHVLKRKMGARGLSSCGLGHRVITKGFYRKRLQIERVRRDHSFQRPSQLILQCPSSPSILDVP